MGERDQPRELAGILLALPGGMIAVLFAALLIPPRGLDVTLGLRADPYILPRGRNGERADARQRGLVRDRFAVNPAIGEAAAAPDAADAGRGIRDVAKLRRRSAQCFTAPWRLMSLLNMLFGS